jgi:hypothetical protein
VEESIVDKMSSDILARLVAVQVELTKIAVELAGASTPQKASKAGDVGAPVKARKPKKISAEVLEQLKTSSADVAKAIDDSSSENSSGKKKRVISAERMAYLKSPEHAAKLKAGREVKKARKNAEQQAQELVRSLEETEGQQDSE